MRAARSKIRTVRTMTPQAITCLMPKEKTAASSTTKQLNRTGSNSWAATASPHNLKRHGLRIAGTQLRVLRRENETIIPHFPHPFPEQRRRARSQSTSAVHEQRRMARCSAIPLCGRTGYTHIGGRRIRNLQTHPARKRHHSYDQNPKNIRLNNDGTISGK